MREALDDATRCHADCFGRPIGAPALRFQWCAAYGVTRSQFPCRISSARNAPETRHRNCSR